MTVKWNGDAQLGRLRAGAMLGVTEAINIVDRRAVSLILDTPKTGRVYKRRGATHQASAPGEPPASDTGTLLNRRHIDLFPERLAARLTFSAAHALPLELGTRHMEPRPFAVPALRQTEAEARGVVIDRIRDSLR